MSGRRALLAMAIAAQVAVLAYMAFSREYIVRTGDTVYLRTAPVDPRDPFRGDFVQLAYPFSRVARATLDADTDQAIGDRRGAHVYALLQPAGGGVHGVTGFSARPPAQGLYMHGRSSYSNQQTVDLRFGIEQYFVQQGQGREMEKRLGRGADLQVPLEMALALGANGTAIIKGHRWSHLGIQVQVTRRPPRPAPGRMDTPQPPADAPVSPAITVTLRNVSDQPLALADPGAHCGFSLQQADLFEPRYQDRFQHFCQRVSIGQYTLRLLQPGQDYQVSIDFSNPRWHLQGDDGIVELGALPWNRQVRVLYRSPDVSAVADLPGAEFLWQGELAGRAVSVPGSLD